MLWRSAQSGAQWHKEKLTTFLPGESNKKMIKGADLLSSTMKEIGTEVWKCGLTFQWGRGHQMTVNHHRRHALLSFYILGLL